MHVGRGLTVFGGSSCGLACLELGLSGHWALHHKRHRGSRIVLIFSYQAYTCCVSTAPLCPRQVINLREIRMFIRPIQRSKHNDIVWEPILMMIASIPFSVYIVLQCRRALI